MNVGWLIIVWIPNCGWRYISGFGTRGPEIAGPVSTCDCRERAHEFSLRDRAAAVAEYVSKLGVTTVIQKVGW